MENDGKFAPRVQGNIDGKVTDLNLFAGGSQRPLGGQQHRPVILHSWGQNLWIPARLVGVFLRDRPTSQEKCACQSHDEANAEAEFHKGGAVMPAESLRVKVIEWLLRIVRPAIFIGDPQSLNRNLSSTAKAGIKIAIKIKANRPFLAWVNDPYRNIDWGRGVGRMTEL
jgi:hypothetical protein